jgi:hypothetical protein
MIMPTNIFVMEAIRRQAKFRRATSGRDCAKILACDGQTDIHQPDEMKKQKN